jgi:threonine/homoserine/homoserine lactone efflux protein
VAFSVIKYAGAAYLVYLGIKALRAKETGAAQAQFSTASSRRIFRDGFVVALLNPKTAIFFAAFLPQFMDPAGPAMLQSITLGAVFVVLAATTDCIYVMAASMVAPLFGRMKGASALGRYVTGSAFIGLGVFTAVSGGRTSK